MRETIQGLDKGQSLAFASIHSREGLLPKNLPMTAWENDSLLVLIMERGIVRVGLPLIHEGEGREADISERGVLRGAKKRFAKVWGRGGGYCN